MTTTTKTPECFPKHLKKLPPLLVESIDELEQVLMAIYGEYDYETWQNRWDRRRLGIYDKKLPAPAQEKDTYYCLEPSAKVDKRISELLKELGYSYEDYASSTIHHSLGIL